MVEVSSNFDALRRKLEEKIFNDLSFSHITGTFNFHGDYFLDFNI